MPCQSRGGSRKGARAGGRAAPEEPSCCLGNQTHTGSNPRSLTPTPPRLITTLSLSLALFSAVRGSEFKGNKSLHWRNTDVIVNRLHIPRILWSIQNTQQFSARTLIHAHARIHAHTLSLTPVVEAVIVVVVLVVVLQGRGAAGAQFCQSAAGGRKLRAEVGHFLTGGLDGPINPLCQMFVVFHHFKDFPLRTKSIQSSMMSSGALEG